MVELLVKFLEVCIVQSFVQAKQQPPRLDGQRVLNAVCVAKLLEANCDL